MTWQLPSLKSLKLKCSCRRGRKCCTSVSIHIPVCTGVEKWLHIATFTPNVRWRGMLRTNKQTIAKTISRRNMYTWLYRSTIQKHKQEKRWKAHHPTNKLAVSVNSLDTHQTRLASALGELTQGTTHQTRLTSAESKLTQGTHQKALTRQGSLLHWVNSHKDSPDRSHFWTGWTHSRYSPDKARFCTDSICCKHSSISSCSFSMSSVGTRATLVRLGVSRVGGLSDLSFSAERHHHS